MASTDPVVWSDEHAAWLVRSYTDVVSVLQDDRFSASGGRAPSAPDVPSAPPDPNIAGLRQHIASTLHLCRPWLRDIMRAEAECILRKKLRAKSSFDLAGDLIQPWCRQLAARLIAGEQELSIPQLRELDHAAQAVFQLGAEAPGETHSQNHAHQGTSVLAAFFLERLQSDSQHAHHGSLLDTLTDGPYSPSELVATCVQLFVGVSTSLPLLLGNAMHLLYTTPEMAANFLRDPVEPHATEARRAISELLRIAGPAKVIYRIATSAINVGDRTFKSGDRLALALDEANREIASIVTSPLTHCPHAEAIPHLSLGMGSHACLGSPIIHEACAFLLSWILETFPAPTWSLDEEQARRGGHRTISGYTRLPVSKS